MLFIVPQDRPVKLARRKGETVTIFNNTGATVYFDSDRERLASYAPGVAPDGTPILTGTSVQITDYPEAGYWFRSLNAVGSRLDVQP